MTEYTHSGQSYKTNSDRMYALSERHAHTVLYRLIICFCLVALLAGCAAQSESLRFRTLDENYALNYFERRFEPDLYAMESQDDVEYVAVELAQELREGGESSQQDQMIEQLRQVDLSSQVAILVLQGPVGGMGGIDVTKVTLNDDRVRVYADFTAPKPGETVPAIASDPYELILVEKNNIDETSNGYPYLMPDEQSRNAAGYDPPVSPKQPVQRDPWDSIYGYELIVKGEVVAFYRIP